MKIDNEKIPQNCYECQIRPTCNVLPRWAEKDYWEQYKNKRHKQCPYTELINAFDYLDKMKGGTE